MLAAASLGLNAYSAFSSQGGGGGVQQKPPLSEANKKLIKNVGGELDKRFKQADRGGVPNITHRILGRVWQNYQSGHRQADKTLTAASAMGEPGMGGGMLASARLSLSNQKAADRQSTAAQGVEAKISNYRDIMGKGTNLYQSEAGMAGAVTQAGYQAALTNAQIRSQQGQILGNIAQMGGMMYAMPKIYGKG